MLMGSLMMEEKQLDFNRPLLSVRRPESKTRTHDSVVTNKKIPLSSSSSPPVYKSDIKSGPVRNPGTVPFQWEHKPGKPKDETKSDLKCSVESHFVPKLPPGRKQEHFGRKLEVNVEDVKSFDDDSDDTYVEANDTFSRCESFYLNCSNVSGLDGSGSGILVEPFGSLSSDRQTQDLMMGRFLPAAKALTSETLPQLARKQPKPEEDESPRRLMKKPVKEKQSKTEQNQEEEDEKSSSIASGVCGLVPHICLRSSFGILNPVPSVRMQAQRAVSVRRMRSKYQDSTSPCNEKQNKQTNETARKLKLNDSVSQGNGNGKVDNFSAASRAKTSKKFGELLASDDNTWPEEAPMAEKTLYVDIVHSVDKKVQEESKKQSLLSEHPSLHVDGHVKDVNGACEEAIITEHPSLDALGHVKDVSKPIRAGEEATLEPKSTEKMNVKRDEDNIEFSCPKVEECHDHHHQAKVALQESNKIDLEVPLQRITPSLESSRLHHHIVPPPPLPKAPTDSWLKRTLPTISSKNNSFTWLQSDNNNHFTKIKANPKWETLVKTSITPFSKEVLNTIPEA